MSQLAVKETIAQTSEDTHRKQYIDICKGIGIILVVVGHISFPKSIIQYIFSFHMPMFILLSGMVFNPEILTKNLKSLCQTFVFMSLLVLVPYCTYHAYRKNSPSELIRIIIDIAGGSSSLLSS